LGLALRSLQHVVKQEQKQPEGLHGLSVINSFWQAKISRQVFFYLNEVRTISANVLKAVVVSRGL